MTRPLVVAVVASAIYGASIGSVHSLDFASRNLLKFPLLILCTCAVCAVAWFVLGQLVSSRLRFAVVQRLAVETFRDVALLLASLSPACLFLARTIRQADADGLHEYPLFLGLNVAFIAVCGSLSLVHRGLHLLCRHALSARAAATAVIGWLALSLLVGGQAAWYLRPFFGISTERADQTPLFLGTRPDYRGDTSFYQAVFHIVCPP